MSTTNPDMQNELLRHTLATIDYRFRKATHEFPAGFGQFSLGKGVRTPTEIIRHMFQVLSATKIFLEEGAFRRPNTPDLDLVGEHRRFLGLLVELDEVLAKQELTKGATKRLIQGPFSDVLTHVGQIAMMQRLMENPIPYENFSIANIKTDLSAEG